MSHSHKDNPITAKSRVVRVFVSSTFRDMREEREHLVKIIFPELRRRCRERGVEFVDVDLRWGITEKQAEQGEALPICLAEIENCRPYFIGLLGERYGWVPDDIDPELVETQPWMAQHREQSITALEILHGALNNPAMAERACFYFRDSSYVESLPPEMQADFAFEDPTARIKLNALKTRIRESYLYLRESYPDPETVGQWIQEDIWKAIDREYPAGSELDPLDQEASGHEAFAESRLRVYVGRQVYFERLDAHIKSDSPPLVLLGDSGVGKSALLANWVRRYQKMHPEDFLLVHFIGGTPDSADYVEILRRIMQEIKRRYNVDEEIPALPEKLREEFPVWLARASGKGRIVLVLDGLNQLEDRDNAPDLGWLPGYFPEGIRVILSTLPGRSLTALEKRGWPTYHVAGLLPEERGRVIEGYLGQYRKTLSLASLDRIAAAPQTANPLFLRALLEELRVFGLYEELDNRINYYLEAQIVPALYDKILNRLEGDYEKDKPRLVGEALSLIWAARRGLYESELLQLLGSPDSPLPRYVWSPLYLAFEESLVSRSGLLNFFHGFFRKAVEDRYLYNPELKRTARLCLADYFVGREIDQRKADELPWQLAEAKEWERLKGSVTDMDIFLRLMRDNKEYELMGYWLSMGDRFDMVKAYHDSVKQYEKIVTSDKVSAHLFAWVAQFLKLNARYDGAEPLFRRALAIDEKVLSPNHPSTATGLNNLAGLLRSKGDDDGAEPLHRRALAIREKVLGPEHPDVASSLNNFAGLLRSKGDYDGAEPLYRRALAITEKTLSPEHPVVDSSLHNFALFLFGKGDYDSAEPLYLKSLKFRERTYGLEAWEVASSLTNLSVLYRNQGRYDKAEPLNERALKTYAKALGLDHPNTANTGTNFALLKFLMGKNNEAVELCKRFLDAHRDNEERDGSIQPYQLRKLAQCYHDLACYADVPAKEWKDAEKHYKLAIDYFDQLKDQTGRAKSELDLQEMFRMSEQKIDKGLPT